MSLNYPSIILKNLRNLRRKQLSGATAALEEISCAPRSSPKKIELVIFDGLESRYIGEILVNYINHQKSFIHPRSKNLIWASYSYSPNLTPATVLRDMVKSLNPPRSLDSNNLEEMLYQLCNIHYENNIQFIPIIQIDRLFSNSPEKAREFFQEIDIEFSHPDLDSCLICIILTSEDNSYFENLALNSLQNATFRRFVFASVEYELLLPFSVSMHNDLGLNFSEDLLHLITNAAQGYPGFIIQFFDDYCKRKKPKAISHNHIRKLISYIQNKTPQDLPQNLPQKAKILLYCLANKFVSTTYLSRDKIENDSALFYECGNFVEFTRLDLLDSLDNLIDFGYLNEIIYQDVPRLCLHYHTDDLKCKLEEDLKQKYDYSRTRSIIEFIKNNHCEVEYKASLRYYPDNNHLVDCSLEKEVIFDLTAFLNSRGGFLILGVREDRGEVGEVVGIERDYPKLRGVSKNLLGYKYKIRKVLKNYFNLPLLEEIERFIEINFETTQNGYTICYIKVPHKFPKPVYVKYAKSKVFPIRKNKRTHILKGEKDITTFIQDHW